MERNGPSMMMGKPSSGVKIVLKSLESRYLALAFVAFLGEGPPTPLYESLCSRNYKSASFSES